MVLLIDGYNLLKSVYSHHKGRLDKQREQLIRQLGYYKEKKSAIKDIIAVFDGGIFPHPSREVHNGIVTIFAGYKSNADRWIIGYVDRNQHREIMVITRDREIIRKCESLGAQILSTHEFYDLFQNALLEDVAEQQSDDGDTKRFDGEQDESSDALDILMEQASLQAFDKNEEEYAQPDRKGASHHLSKKDKKRLKKIEKLK